MASLQGAGAADISLTDLAHLMAPNDRKLQPANTPPIRGPTSTSSRIATRVRRYRPRLSGRDARRRDRGGLHSGGKSSGKDYASLSFAAPEFGLRKRPPAFQAAVARTMTTSWPWSGIRRTETNPALAISAGPILSPHFVSVLSRLSVCTCQRRSAKARRCAPPYLFYDCSAHLLCACRFPAGTFR